MSYSRDEIKFKSSISFFVFILCFVIIFAFCLFSSEISEALARASEYPMIMERGVRMSCEIPAIQLERALSRKSRAAFFRSIAFRGFVDIF